VNVPDVDSNVSRPLAVQYSSETSQVQKYVNTDEQRSEQLL